MSVEKLELQEFIGFCASEAEKRKWFEGAKAFAEGLQALRREQEKAERARDTAMADRTAALAEIATKQAKYEGDIKAALEDLARVTKTMTEANKKAQAEAQAKLDGLNVRISKAADAVELSEAQRDAYREDAEREAVGIKARLEAMRAEERDAKSRFAGVVAALKG